MDSTSATGGDSLFSDPVSQNASKGGKARAESLTPEERRSIARAAVTARWQKLGKSKDTPHAICGSAERPLRIGDMEIPCYVLSDGRRVLHQRGMVASLGMSRGGSSRGGGDRLAFFVSQKVLQPFVNEELLKVTRDPIKFVAPNGMLAYGYEATVLADICEAVLAARNANALQRQQEHIAKQCEILVRGFARVGIIALVDEATGYQDERARNALAKILEAFVAKELRQWVKTFPVDYYKEMYRLRGLQYPPIANRMPQYFGRLTNDVVYSRIAPGVLDELKRKNPTNESGHRLHKHHQWLTQDIGHPKLLQHLSSVVAVMRLADNWDQFKNMIDRALPKQTPAPLFEAENESSGSDAASDIS